MQRRQLQEAGMLETFKRLARAFGDDGQEAPNLVGVGGRSLVVIGRTAGSAWLVHGSFPF
jgi:hypothetical protein